MYTVLYCNHACVLFLLVLVGIIHMYDFNIKPIPIFLSESVYVDCLPSVFKDEQAVFRGLDKQAGSR